MKIMNNDEKRAKVIGCVDDLYGDAGMAVLNMVLDYMSPEDWGDLYDRLERDGSFSEPKDDEDIPDLMKEALDYVRSQLDEWRLEEYRAQINSAYEYHTTPTAYADFDHIRDLLEEYGQENDLPEGWWDGKDGLDAWLYEL